VTVGDRIGLWNHDGWIPAVVIGVCPVTGHLVARTMADPCYAPIMAKRPGYELAFDPTFVGVDTVLYPDAIAWRPASECDFVRVVASTAWKPTMREWERWEPWAAP
jgi:hypothetical protein